MKMEPIHVSDTVTVTEIPIASSVSGVDMSGNVVTVSEKNNNAASYMDVEPSASNSRYIEYATRLGIVSGDGVSTFIPNDPISRGEAMKILVHVFKIEVSPLKGIFSDVPSRLTLAPYIEAAYNSCIIHGINTIDGKTLHGELRIFEPYSTLSLGEAIKILYNETY